jgi:hypothetical protein
MPINRNLPLLPNEAMRPSVPSTMGYAALVIFNHIFAPYFIAAYACSVCVIGIFGTGKSEF